MLEFILVIFLLIVSCGYLLAIMEILKINPTTNPSIKRTTNKSTKTQVTAMDQSTEIPLTKIPPSKQPLSFNREKIFAGTFSDRHAITEDTVSSKNSIQLMMQRIIEGTSLDDSKSTGETPNNISTLEKRPSAAPVNSTKQLKKMTFVADPDILKDSSLLFDKDIAKLFQLNKTAKHRRQK